MKRTKQAVTKTVAATVLSASLLFAGLFTGVASAEDALFASNNVSAAVTFYTADPAAGGVALLAANVNNSPLAVTLDGAATATYATLEYGGKTYGFDLAASGSNKNQVLLELAAEGASSSAVSYVSDTGTLSLGDLLNVLAEDPSLLEQLTGDAPVG